MSNDGTVCGGRGRSVRSPVSGTPLLKTFGGVRYATCEARVKDPTINESK